MRQFTHPIVQVANITNILQSTIASAERVFEVLDEEEQLPDKEEAVVLPFPRGEVRFDHVRFGYSPEALLMEDLSIHVKAGQTVAIVDPPGPARLLLVNLIMRFYEIQGGSITVDGVDIRDMRRGDLRTMFGMVLQDAWLFNGTIRENIGYGKEGASFNEIVAAAKAAHAHHFIMTLPDGYETVLNEEASNISQGQKQLLTIARAVLADPPILILDEATSNVDTRTEVLLQRAMKSLMRGAYQFRHRAPLVNHTRCRPDPCNEPGRYRRAGYAPQLVGPGRLLCRPVPQPVRGRLSGAISVVLGTTLIKFAAV